jgi:hypothetical protein
MDDPAPSTFVISACKAIIVANATPQPLLIVITMLVISRLLPIPTHRNRR